MRRMPEKWAGKKKLGFPVPTRVWLKEDKYYNIVKEKFTGEVAQKYFNTDMLVKLLDGELNGQERVQKAPVLLATILRDNACVLCLNQPSFDQLRNIFSHGVRTHIDCAPNRSVACMALICRPILNVHQVAVDCQGPR